jgi:GNAT superfamily N-acetyltransferase
VEPLEIRLEDPTSPAARSILRDYLIEVVSRYHGRALTDQEVAAAEEEFRSEELTQPAGLFLIASLDCRPVGCVGMRRLAERVGEVTRLFVKRRSRRRGIGRRLMAELENEARRLDVARLRLDTRSDLTEARHLYAAIGFQEVSAFNDGPYAEHWFERSLQEHS